MMRAFAFSAVVAVFGVALSGCVSLQEQRTMQIAFCNSAAPVIVMGGQRLSGFDIIQAVRDRQPERVVLVAESGPLALAAGVMAEALQHDRSNNRDIVFADGASDQAQAARLCTPPR